MSIVWDPDRLPVGGGKLNLALALADFASDDGTRIFPAVRTLARKTRQSERTVQRQLAEFRASGWLIADAIQVEGGGDGTCVRYHINPLWLKGGDIGDTPGGDKLTPPPPAGGDSSDTPGGDTGDTPGVTELWHPGGDTAVSPNPSSDPSSDPSLESPGGLTLTPGPKTTKKAKPARDACRLPEEFELTPARRKFAEQEGIDPVRTFAMFRDHWRAASGKAATKRDWDATWRNWCRRESQFKRDRPGTAGPRRSQAQIEAEELRVLRERRHGMTHGMSNFRDPHRGESAESYRRAMNEEHDRRLALSEPRSQQNARKVGQLVTQLAASKRAPT